MRIGFTPESTIVITGMGAVSAAGGDVASLWRSAVTGESNVTTLRDPCSAGRAPVLVCAVRDSDLRPFALRRYDRMDRSVHLAMNAAVQAYDDAGLRHAGLPRSAVGIVVGTSRGPIHATADAVQSCLSGKSTAPSSSAYTTIACASGAIAMQLNAEGPNLTVSATCASGAHAIIAAAQKILLGEAAHMIAGGTDAPLHDAVIRQMSATGVLGTHSDPRLACRPFDRDRNGTILGEGAAFLVLETLAAATARGATVHARLAGWAIGTDSHHETKPATDGAPLTAVMSNALRMAGLQPQDLGAINLHGTGTVFNDATESMAIESLLGNVVDGVPCSSTKAVTGHCLGAAASLEAVLAVLMLKHQCVPPSAGCIVPDPECRINLVLGSARQTAIRAVLSNSVGFWGNNAALVFTTPD